MCAAHVFQRRKTLSKLLYVAMCACFRRGTQRKLKAALFFPWGKSKEFKSASLNKLIKKWNFGGRTLLVAHMCHYAAAPNFFLNSVDQRQKQENICQFTVNKIVEPQFLHKDCGTSNSVGGFASRPLCKVKTWHSVNLVIDWKVRIEGGRVGSPASRDGSCWVF